MRKKLLIVYETWTGATREVAEAMGKVLHNANIDVDVRRAKIVKDIGPYQGVIVGTSVHMGKLPRAIPGFVKRHRQALQQMPVAYFVVCLTMSEDTPENRETTLAYLDPLREIAPEIEPVDIGLFGGAVLAEGDDFDRLFPLLKIPVRAMAEEQQDHRDWESIRAWAESIGPRLLQD